MRKVIVIARRREVRAARLQKNFDDWQGSTSVILASGPSLTVEDCEFVRAWRDADSNARKVVAVNNTYERALWADVLFAMDHTWWDHYGAKARALFAGKCATSSRSSIVGVQNYRVRCAGNSGAGAILFAIFSGCPRVILVGFDCQETSGRRHWHMDHPRKLGNANAMPFWRKHFARVAESAGATRIINASRATALTCFEREDLDQALYPSGNTGSPHPPRRVFLCPT